ncbi:Protein NRT1/PTR FAMILY 4.3 [Forsythia ovata]|uniref:Protein NRT1/PTR FAMILY 4.3 n=1 Tax=Forsythia ovata TaxID=205694 RepID=A0ABD1VI50_9LAMI
MANDVKTRYNAINPWNIKEKGGFKATSFIYALVALENMGFVANMVSMVMYFFLKMHFDLSGSANTLTNLMGSTYLLSVVGGFISDTYLNRFNTSITFGILELLALVMMTIQAHNGSLQPEACGMSSCVKGGIAVMFYASLCLLALGTGGVKGSLPPLGADQFDSKDPKESKALASYFNWLLLSSTIGSSIGVTVIVWVSTSSNNNGWWKGFLIITITTFIGYFFLVLGKPFYRLEAPGDSPIIRIAQVVVVAIKNRGLSLPENSNELYEINEKESVSAEAKIAHTEQFRCLDKAAILRDNAKPIPWTVCTVTQVEEVKVLTRMLPIIASTILLNTCMAQLQTFSVQQGSLMDRKLGSFQVPAPSVPVIPLAFMIILIPIYEIIFVPFARKITKNPSGITQLQRVGVGLVLSAISMLVAALVEVKRKKQFLKSPTNPISLFWLSFQYAIFGIADMFTLVGLLEFFYKEAPAGMRSLSTSFTWISQSFGYFMSSIFVDIINSVTKRISPSKKGWLYGQDLNKNNLNLFYWFLAILSCLNFVNYLYWATWYKYKTEDTTSIGISMDKSPSISSVPLIKTAEIEVSKTTNGGSIVDHTQEISWKNNQVFESDQAMLRFFLAFNPTTMREIDYVFKFEKANIVDPMDTSITRLKNRQRMIKHRYKN